MRRMAQLQAEIDAVRLQLEKRWGSKTEAMTRVTGAPRRAMLSRSSATGPLQHPAYANKGRCACTHQQHRRRFRHALLFLLFVALLFVQMIVVSVVIDW